MHIPIYCNGLIILNISFKTVYINSAKNMARYVEFSINHDNLYIDFIFASLSHGGIVTHATFNFDWQRHFLKSSMGLLS